MRIATAAMVFAVWTRPWRTFAAASREARLLLLLLGTCLAVMNCSFYLAISRLPLALVATIEFVWHDRTGTHRLARAAQLRGAGIRRDRRVLLTQPQWTRDPLGIGFAVEADLARCQHRHRRALVGDPVHLRSARNGATATQHLCLLSLLPATATIVGAIVLGQVPSLRELSGIVLVMAGVAIHRPATP